MRKYDHRNVPIIKQLVELGMDLAEKYPEIASDYKEGMTQREISRKYDVSEIYRVGEEQARNIVHFALNGNSGSFGTTPYRGLMSELELAETRSWFPRIELDDRCIIAEKDFLYGLSLHPDNMKGSLFRVKRIARILNETYHEGEVFRSLSSVSKALSDMHPERGRFAKVSWNDVDENGRTEEDLLIELMDDDTFRTDGRYDLTRIADRLNTVRHDGKRVRSKMAVSAKIDKLKRLNLVTA